MPTQAKKNDASMTIFGTGGESMDRVLLIDFDNYAWLANITFKPKPAKPIVVEGYGDQVVNTFEAPQSTEEKPVPPENVLIFNFFRNLRSLVEPFAPHKIIAVLEGHPAFRYDIFPDYKGNRRIVKTAARPTVEASEIKRAEAKARFDKAHPEILRLMLHLPITQVKHLSYEADDTISSLVEDCKDEDVIVVSNDSDYIQLTQKGYKQFRLYSPSKKKMIEAPPYHYLTWKCLAGDVSDNVPSCGMGKKTAEKIASDPEKLKTWLSTEEHRAIFEMNRQLISFAQVPLEEAEIVEGCTDWKALKTEFERLDFKSMLAETYWSKFKKTWRSVKF